MLKPSHNLSRGVKRLWKHKQAAFVLLGGVLAVFLLMAKLSTSNATYPEVSEISQKSWSFTDLSSYFTDLANRKGAVYAFEVLKQAPIPPGTDVHLLGHAVGDILYKQDGASGIKKCTQDFRNACSHSIVIGLFQDKGETAVPEIAQACRQAPGGPGAYTMCFHGLGHGILAYYGYDMAKADTVCNKLGTPQYNNREGVECIGGTVMEIITGGGHEHEIWSRQNEFYLHADIPLGLCQNSFIPNPAKQLCYTYLTPYLFIAAGGDLGNPEKIDFRKAFSFCNALPESESDNRRACFSGFGKEFIVIAQGRDIRKIDQLNATQLEKVYQWCKLAPQDTAVSNCLGSAVASMYWGGENDYHASITLCSLTTSTIQKTCFSDLINTVFYYTRDPNYRQRVCSNLPTDYQNECKERSSGV